MKPAGSIRRARSRLDLALAAAAPALFFALGLGFLGRVAAPLDSLSHFRLHLAGLAAILAATLLMRRRLVPALALFAAAAGATFTVLPFLRAEAPVDASGPVYSLLQMNLRWNATEPVEAIRRIAEAQADIVTLQEMTPDWRSRLAPLEASYPYQVHCPGADGFRGDSALLSRRPFMRGTEPVCDERNSFAEARIDFNGIGLSVASHHQLWPWPAGQWRRLERLEPTLEALPEPLLLVGDFNAVPWSAFVERYAMLLDARIVTGIGPVWAPTFVPHALRRTLGLPLNNVLASPAVGIVAVERLFSTSSDHLPVLVRFTLDGPGEEGARVSVAGRRDALSR